MATRGSFRRESVIQRNRRHRVVGSLATTAILAVGLAVVPMTTAHAAADPSCASPAYESVYTGGTGAFNVAASWSTGSVPNNTQDACIPAGKTVLFAANASVGSLTIANGSTLLGTSVSQSLTVTGGSSTYTGLSNYFNLAGSLTIVGDVNNYGAIAPGTTSAGQMRITGDLLSSGAGLGLRWFDNNGTPGTSFSTLEVQGAWTATGTPRISVLNAGAMNSTSNAYSPVSFLSSNLSLANLDLGDDIVGVYPKLTVGPLGISVTPSPNQQMVSGVVTNDWNLDNVAGPGEPGLSGQTLYVDYNNNSALDTGEPTATTSADGSFTVGPIEAGAWVARFVNSNLQVPYPFNYAYQFRNEPNVTGLTTPAHFPASISGTLTLRNGSPAVGVSLYDDANGDGTRQATENLVTTNAQGGYVLTSMSAGAHNVKLLAPFIFAAPIAPVTVGVTAVNNANAVVDSVSTTAPKGYRLTSADGSGTSFGAGTGLTTGPLPQRNAPVVSGATLADGSGSYTVASDGGVFTAGTASFFGSAGSIKLNKPIVAMALTPSQNGYYLFAADGGVFSYGDATFAGSLGSQALNAPIVGGAADPDGTGYYLVASDGGVFAFGSTFRGSLGSQRLDASVVAMAATPDGGGYYLASADGGVFSFGAPFYGSAGNLRLNAPVVGLQTTADGYRLVAGDGGVFTFGAPFYGSAVGRTLTAPVVAIS